MSDLAVQQPDRARQPHRGPGVVRLRSARLISSAPAAPAPRPDRWRAARDRMAAPAATR
jgi:hypothetical protein